jgi:gliding motility-associated-like protein
VHIDGTPSVGFRNFLEGDISPLPGNRFAFGNVRPLIREQPADIAVCDGTEATFSVVATGVGTLYYQWQEFGETGWQDIVNSDKYSGAQSPNLVISGVDLNMDGYQYRVRISHLYGHVNWSEWATLTVNPLPVAIATPQKDTLCDGETTFIELTSDVQYTTFELEVLYSGNIDGASTLLDGDTIKQTLVNLGDYVDSVVYRIIPTGPFTTFCVGHADTAVVYVNPTPRVILPPDYTQCDSTTTSILLESPSIFASGVITFSYTAAASGNPGDVTGFVFSDSNLPLNYSIEHQLVNHTDQPQTVTYTVTPVHPGACSNGPAEQIVVTIEPTPRVFPVPADFIQCDSTVTSILLESPSTFTSGVITFAYTAVGSGSTGDITGFTASDGNLPLNYIIEHELVNHTDVPQTVTYTITPVHPGSCNNGPPQTVVVTVNPTPRIYVTISNALISSDTVFCNNYEVVFDLFNNQVATGDIRYHLEVTGDVGIVQGFTPSTDSLDIVDFSNTLWHSDDTIRELRYRFIPYIENATGTTGCYRGVDTTVVVKILPVLSAIETPKVLDPGGFNITCHGLSDGEILLTPTGGDLRYSYEIIWENEAGEVLQTAQAKDDFLENRPAGIYEYFITDTIGCFFSNTFELTEPDTLAIDDYIITKQECFGDAPTGAIEVDLSGGVDINDYSWRYLLSGGIEVANTEDLLTAKAGVYRYIFKDAFQCTFDTTFIIEPANRLDSDTTDFSVYGNYNITCNGESDGFIEVIGLGGTGAGTYSYKWYTDPTDDTPLSTSSRIENQPAGIYYYWIEDGNGCRLGTGQGADSLIAIELREPDPITFHRDPADLYPGEWDISCFESANGRINLEYRGGHTEYLDNTFIWTGSTFSVDSVLSDLDIGTYTVTVTDAFGCSNDTTITLEQPDEIIYTTEVSSFAGGNNISSFDRADGFINLAGIDGGGTKSEEGIYTYLWTAPAGKDLDDATAKDQGTLGAGRYYFTITDQIGCAVMDSVDLIQPDSLYAIPDTAMRNGFAISCFNGSDGEVSLTPFGGTRPYSYEWSEAGSGSDTLVTGLPSGYYSVKITDANGCENFYEWQLEYPDTIVLNPDPNRLIECFGGTDTIRIDPQGGVGGYSYLWNGTVTDKDLTNAAEGNHVVVVTDANGCVVTESLYLGQRSRIMPEIVVTSDYNGQHISCYGLADAAIELVISGGNDLSYNFEWNTGVEDNNRYQLSGLPAGIYSVSGTDASGCPFDTTKAVIQPTAIDVSYTSEDPLCAGVDNGTIQIFVVGGTPFTGSPVYNYSLNGFDNLPVPEFRDLSEGEYVIAVTDANGCSDTTVVVISSPDFLEMEYETTDAECRDKANGTLTITNIDGGTMPYFINGGIDRYFDNLPPGPFVIELADANGCMLVDTATINALRLSCLDIPTAFSPNNDGANDVWILDEDADGVNDMFLYPNAELRIYDRWGVLVYYTNSVASEPWDGRYRRRDLPIDSYHYVLDLGNGDPPITGNITIVR